MKKEGLRLFNLAIDWIAANDERGEYDRSELSHLISVNLVADVFDMHRLEVADLVVEARVSLDMKEKMESEDE